MSFAWLCITADVGRIFVPSMGKNASIRDLASQNATYICDRPGPVEDCVDAADGACVKTLCDNIVCPDEQRARPTMRRP